MSLGSRDDLVGRESEMAFLTSFLRRRATGGGVVTVRGAAGTGKTAILAELGLWARSEGFQILGCAGVEAEARLPYAGLRQLLARSLDEVSALDDSRRRPLLGALGEAGSPPGVFLVGLATLDLFGDLASRRPLVLLLDDAHWLDDATLEVLSFVMRRVEADPVAGVLSCRSGFGAPLGRESVEELELTGLEDEPAAALLDARFPSLEPSARGRVLRLSAGNPLALTELPRSRPLVTDRNEVSLTRKLEWAFAGRLGELPSASRMSLLVAAVDERLSLGEVLRATSMILGNPVGVDWLVPAVAAHLVEISGPALRFRHPLIAAAVRQAAQEDERRRAHAAVADVLAAEPARSVWHEAAAALGADEDLAERLAAGADDLRRRHGTLLALTALSRAAELSPSPTRRGRHLVAASELALELGRTDEVPYLLDLAESLPLDQRTRHALLWQRAALSEATGTGSLETLLATAEQLARGDDPELALRALFTAATRAFMFTVTEDVRSAIVGLAGTLRLPAGDARRAVVNALADSRRQTRRVMADIRGITPEQVFRTSDPVSAADACHLYGLALTCIGEFRSGVPFQDAAIAAFRAQGRLGLLCRALGSNAIVRLCLADWGGAVQAADECIRLTGYVRGVPESVEVGEEVLNIGSALLVLATADANRGRTEAAEALAAEAVRVQGGIGASYCLALIEVAKASLALAGGRPTEAFEHASRIFDRADVAHHESVSLWAPVVRDLVDAALASGNSADAKGMLEYADRSDGSRESRGTLAYADAVLAGDDYEARYRRALTLASESGFFQARLQLAYGARLRRERRPAAARPYLRSAIDEFDAIRADPWARRAREELRASGETIRRGVPGRRDELSPQEMQIAQLAAQGLTNRQVAERLFLSHRTVGAHLYRIFPKLGISSRADLRGALGQMTDATSD